MSHRRHVIVVSTRHPRIRALAVALLGTSLGLATSPSRASGPFHSEPEPRFVQLSSQDGLPDNSIYAIAQDQSGFLWVGTERGISRYDGYSFERLFDGAGGRISSLEVGISALLVDRSGILWIATWGEGLLRFDPSTGSLERHRADSDSTGHLRDGRIQDLWEDRSGALWIGTFEGGLSRFEPESRTFHTFRHSPGDPTSLAHDRVWSIADGPDGHLWVATEGGVSVLDRSTGTFENLFHDPDDPTSLSHQNVRQVYTDSAGVLWVGTWQGLNRLDPLSRTFERFYFDTEDPISPLDVINVLLEDSRGRFWVGTDDGGLHRFDRSSGEFRTFTNDPGDRQSLAYDDVRALYEDRSGVLWVGTRGGGLDKLDAKPAKFRHLGRDGRLEGLSGSRVYALAEDPDGSLWVGTDSGLDRFDRAGGVLRLRHDPEDPRSLPEDRVSGLLVDRRGNLWVTGWSGVLSRFVGETRDFVHQRTLEGEATGFREGVTAVAEDRSGLLWVGSRQGLEILDPVEGTSQPIHLVFEDDGDPPFYVRTISFDARGFVWVGTDASGLLRVDPESLVAQRRRHDPSDPASLSSDRITSLRHVGEGVLWVGTDRGLDRLGADGKLERYGDRVNLPSSKIAGILPDDRGRIWMGTSQGLWRVDPASDTFRSYSAKDGLTETFFEDGAALRASDGVMYFGGIYGLTSFRPDEVVDNLHPPSVVITAIRALGMPLPLAVPPWEVRSLEVSHEDSYLSFDVAALDFTSPDQNRYRYKMEPLDRDWVEAGTHHSISYASLQPGRYELWIDGSNNDGFWSNDPIVLGLTITPPFWRTSWFRIFALLGLAASVAAGLELRTRGLRRREVELGLRVKESLAELGRSEEKYRQLFERNMAGVARLETGGAVLDCNDAFARILGYESHDECLGVETLKLELAAEEESLADRLLRERSLLGVELSARARDGEQVRLLGNTALVEEADGSRVVECTVIDVTERLRMEERLRTAQKMESLGLLAGGVAHDFNNILMGIVGNAELITLDDRASEHAEAIKTAAFRASGLASQLLAYSGQGSFEVGPVDLSEEIESLLELLRGVATSDTRLEADLDRGLPLAEADATQISQVVVNLVTNAFEAIGPEREGLVVVRTGWVHCSRRVLARSHLGESAREGDHVFLEVSDDGSGMDRTTRLRLFDPFFTTKFVGRGLGMAVVLGIVRSRRGSITVDSSPGRGTTIRVTFPASEVERLDRVAREEGRRPLAGTVLVVDDEPAVRDVAVAMLQHLGLTAMVAADGLEGVETYRRHLEAIDLVMLDLKMPRMNGEEAFEQIRRLRPDARILVCTGWAEEKVAGRFADLEDVGFLHKPYGLSDLRETISILFGGGGA